MKDYLEIHALADGQLEGEAKQAAEARLRECAQSRAELEAVQSVKSILRKRSETHACTATWERCRKRFDEMDRAKRVEGFVGRYAWGICAIFFVVILSAAVFNRTLGNTGIGTADVARMVSSFGPLGLTASETVRQPEDMRQWMNRAPATLSTGNLQIVGFERLSYKGRPVAAFGLQDASGRVILLVIEGARQVDGVEPIMGDSRYSAGKIDNLNAISWSQKDHALMVIGPRTLDALRGVAQEVQLR